MSYKVIETNSIEDLEEKVRDLLVNGWKLEGGVSVCAYISNVGLDCNFYYYQALSI
jgi:hypothetical protein